MTKPSSGFGEGKYWRRGQQCHLGNAAKKKGSKVITRYPSVFNEKL
jgi:hypothetical protein